MAARPVGDGMTCMAPGSGPRAALLALALLLVGERVGPGTLSAGQPPPTPSHPPRGPFMPGAVFDPHFADPDRRPKLLSALPRIEELVRQRQQQGHLPGVFYGILIDGELVSVQSIGVRDVERSAPVSADTVFRIASMTKSFTALAILKLRDQGKLTLDAPISTFVPEAAGWTYPTRDTAPITVRQLLTHAAGFPEDNPWGDRQLAIGGDTMASWLRAGIPFSNPPGVAYEYSNYGFAILGRIVAVASGQPYREFVSREILQPLGLKSTFWEAASVPADRIAHGYRWQDGQWLREVPLADGAFGAMGGLYTSGRDLARYVAFQMSAWPPRDDPDGGPVRRSSLREMQQGWQHVGLAVDRRSPDEPVTASTRSYGYGLSASRDCRLGYTVAHSGGLPGYGSNMIWLPDHGVGVIAMANLTYAPAAALTRDILDVLDTTGGLEPRLIKASAAVLETRDAILRLLQAWDDAAADRLAADNLFLDHSAERRKAELERVRQDVGQCTEAGAPDPENWLRARFRATCERGWVDVAFTLAPTKPPRVQFLSIQPGKPMSPSMRTIAERLAPAMGTVHGEAAVGLMAGGPGRTRLASQLRAINANYGSCEMVDAISGNGDTSARVRYTCERGSLDAFIERDPAASVIKSVRFARSPGDACVP
jgi:CubicO group peptidase (beta-lactamase class C family)